MHVRNIALFVILNLASGRILAAEQPSRTRSHYWNYINYPNVSLPQSQNEIGFTVRGSDKMQGLTLQMWSGSQREPAYFTNGTASARLLREGGTVQSPEDGGFQGAVGIGNASSTTWATIVQFPWSENTLNAAWIEVTVSNRCLWLEIPYGFDRDPKLPLPPRQPGGQPKFPAAIHRPESAEILRWQQVQYDFGEIQNSWRLSLILSNRTDATCDVVLYREDSAIGKSMYLWNLDSPRTAVQIFDSPQKTIKSLNMSRRLHEDGMYRTDSFHIFRDAGSDRSWGQIEISVDDKNYRLTVPSSLYRYTHGFAGS